MNESKRESGPSEEQIERLLRSQHGIELSAGFKRALMQRIEQLPAPRFADLPQGRVDLGWLLRHLALPDRLGLGALALGLLALLVPGVSDTLGHWQLALGSFELSLSLGESAASMSLLSLATLALCLGFMGILGSFAARNKLISA